MDPIGPTAPPARSLSVIIVNWNTRERLLRCLESLDTALPPIPVQVIVVDNGSHDGSVDAIRQSYPRHSVIANTSNRGFSGGINDGLRIATGAYVLILNPDILAGSGVIERLVTYLEANAEVAAATPLLRGEDGMPQQGYIRRFPSVMQVLLFDTEIYRMARRSQSLVHWCEEYPVTGLRTPVDVDAIAGAFLFARRGVLQETRGFDEQYLLFYEDVDWSFRVRQLGYRLVLLPDLSVTHAGGRSIAPLGRPWVAARYRMSMIRFFAIHRGVAAATAVTVFLLASSCCVALSCTAVLPFVNARRRQTARGLRERDLGFLQAWWKYALFCKDVELPG